MAQHEILGRRQEQRFAEDHRAINRLLFGMDWRVIVRLRRFRGIKSTYVLCTPFQLRLLFPQAALSDGGP